MISEFVDRQATNTDLFELEDVLTGENGSTALSARPPSHSLEPTSTKPPLTRYWRPSFPRRESRNLADRRLPGIGLNMMTGR